MMVDIFLAVNGWGQYPEFREGSRGGGWFRVISGQGSRAVGLRGLGLS